MRRGLDDGRIPWDQAAATRILDQGLGVDIETRGTETMGLLFLERREGRLAPTAAPD